MAIKLYGLKNCDTCRKASQWLEAQGIAFEFVDIRQEGVVAAHLEDWVVAVDWETLVNRRSRTWRELDASERDDLDTGKAQALMQAQPTLIKRPVLDHAGGILVGFSEAEYAATLLG